VSRSGRRSTYVGQTARRLSGAAGEYRGVEFATDGIADDAVFDAVSKIAGMKCCLMEKLQIGAVQHRLAVASEKLSELPHLAHADVRFARRVRCDRDDAVEVPREALRLHEPLVAAG
jgi:hypothetical protein